MSTNHPHHRRMRALTISCAVALCSACGTAADDPQDRAREPDGLGQQQAPSERSVVSTEQVLRGMRPEFFDYFWSNLDAALFAKWHPEAHESFAWTSAPKVPGDLGAEVGASYTARVRIGGAAHDLTVTYVAATPEDGATLETATAAEVRIDGAGPYRLLVEYQLEGDDTRLRQKLALPAGADQAAVKAYLEARMTTLAGFIREPFQKQYVDVELTKRGTIQVIPGTQTMDVVVTQRIGKVTPQMVDWWWDNMGGNEHYRHWHPTAHQQFTWTTPPKNPNDLFYDVGSMQQVVEVIEGATTLNIGWLDPKMVPIPLTYTHFLYGSTNLNGTPFGGFLVHEYDAAPEGGVTMKSTFRVPSLGGDSFAQALGRHCVQEMQFLQYYLPRLFAREFKPAR